MRVLYLLRGAPGAGKSTWIREHQLEPYTLSADNIRQMVSGLSYNIKGEAVIPQEHDNMVWKILMDRLEDRMDRGEFVIVDATHYRAALLQQYKTLISKYRYRAYVIDFTDVPEDVALERNASREAYKRVPVNAIRKMYRVFESDRKEVSNRFTIISPTEAIDMLYRPMLFDYNHYKKIYVIGDIHGCYAPLKAFFDEHPMTEDNAYIFTGDYLDRGIQNKEVLEFMLSIYNNKNVLLLEGNHERWIRMYAEGEPRLFSKEEKEMLKPYVDKTYWHKYDKKRIRNRGFRDKTIPQIADISKKDLKQFCRRFGQMAYVNFHGRNYYVSHGGTPMLPSIFIPTETYIDGTGKYEDVDYLYQYFEMYRSDNDVLIHAHRNVFKYDVKINDHVYNLCDDIEYGGYLRVLEIDENGEHVLRYKNDIFDQELVEQKRKRQEFDHPVTGNNLIDQLNNTSLVQKKDLGNGIVSYNFTRTAFNDKRWNQLTCTARGLFVKGDKVIARSYDKFFNWGENDLVSNRALLDKIVFPVNAFRKENGFLAIISHYNGELMICSKSTNKGDYVQYIKNQVDTLPEDTRKKMLDYITEHDCSFVFECIDPKNDPHIVQYTFPHLVLLDIIKNDLTMQKVPYDEMVKIAVDMKLEHKIHEYTFYKWEELFRFIKEEQNKFTPYERFPEGWVFEDANGFMVKYKTTTYTWWKRNRSILEKIQHRHEVKPVYVYEEDVMLFGLLDRLEKEDRLDSMNILDVQQEFYRLR